MRDVKIGATLQKEITVTEAQLARAVGSGDVAVYATPMMLALMEGAAAELLASFLDEGETSVGTMISSTHTAATPAGMKVTATAELTAAEGRKACFQIRAQDEAGLIGEGTHERFVVYREKFEQKARAKGNSAQMP